MVRQLYAGTWPETANRLNKTAVRLMAGIEIQRVMKLMGKPHDQVVASFHDLAEIIDTAFRLVQTNFMTFHFSFPEKNLLRGRFDTCFAHDGVKKFGLIADYECGIVERVKGWLDSLGVAYEMMPDFTGCLMHRDGICEVDFRFDLE